MHVEYKQQLNSVSVPDMVFLVQKSDSLWGKSVRRDNSSAEIVVVISDRVGLSIVNENK